MIVCLCRVGSSREFDAKIVKEWLFPNAIQVVDDKAGSGQISQMIIIMARRGGEVRRKKIRDVMLVASGAQRVGTDLSLPQNAKEHRSSLTPQRGHSVIVKSLF